MREIHAVIGVRYADDKTFYVQRSSEMENYPNVWSLLSIQFDPATIDAIPSLQQAQLLFEQMSAERLCNTPITAQKYINSGRCSNNPIDSRVHLHLYQIELEGDPELNPQFYSDSQWLTPAEYEDLTTDALCGLCMRLWSDYCVKNGITDKLFAPAYIPEDS